MIITNLTNIRIKWLASIIIITIFKGKPDVQAPQEEVPSIRSRKQWATSLNLQIGDCWLQIQNPDSLTKNSCSDPNSFFWTRRSCKRYWLEKSRKISQYRSDSKSHWWKCIWWRGCPKKMVMGINWKFVDIIWTDSPLIFNRPLAWILLCFTLLKFLC